MFSLGQLYMSDWLGLYHSRDNIRSLTLPEKPLIFDAVCSNPIARCDGAIINSKRNKCKAFKAEINSQYFNKAFIIASFL